MPQPFHPLRVSILEALSETRDRWLTSTNLREEFPSCDDNNVSTYCRNLAEGGFLARNKNKKGDVTYRISAKGVDRLAREHEISPEERAAYWAKRNAKKSAADVMPQLNLSSQAQTLQDNIAGLLAENNELRNLVVRIHNELGEALYGPTEPENG